MGLIPALPEPFTFLRIAEARLDLTFEPPYHENTFILPMRTIRL
jgi:hypothetical protein